MPNLIQYPYYSDMQLELLTPYTPTLTDGSFGMTVQCVDQQS